MDIIHDRSLLMTRDPRGCVAITIDLEAISHPGDQHKTRQRRGTPARSTSSANQELACSGPLCMLSFEKGKDMEECSCETTGSCRGGG